jgi:hypothetical protein
LSGALVGRGEMLGAESKQVLDSGRARISGGHVFEFRIEVA